MLGNIFGFILKRIGIGTALGGIGLPVYLSIGVILITAGTALFFYVQSLRYQVAYSEEQKTKLESVIEGQKIANERLNSDIIRIQKSLVIITKEWQKIDEETKRLADRFNFDANGKPRNFSRLVTENPTLLQDKINRGTAFALRCNQIVTGSPITDSDMDNTICPDIIRRSK